MRLSKPLSKVLSYDLGGTKVAAGVVNARGQILDEIRSPLDFERGKTAVLQQLIEIGKDYIQRYPDISRIGIASAGPLDPVHGDLLDPTNFVSSQGTWGKVPITRIFKQKLKRPTFLDNDAAAAILAEHWMGSAKQYKNAMVLTLGTGLGTGFICNNQLVRGGRHLHPEGGHIIVRLGDISAPCGCSNFGCAEAYLSGKNFTRRSRLKLSNPNLNAKDIADLARKKNSIALSLFDEYAEIMASTIQNFVRLYYPEIVIFAGSFAAASDLFMKKTETQLKSLIYRESKIFNLMPKLVISQLENRSGLLGGAYIALKGGSESLHL